VLGVTPSGWILSRCDLTLLCWNENLLPSQIMILIFIVSGFIVLLSSLGAVFFHFSVWETGTSQFRGSLITPHSHNMLERVALIMGGMQWTPPETQLTVLPKSEEMWVWNQILCRDRVWYWNQILRFLGCLSKIQVQILAHAHWWESAECVSLLFTGHSCPTRTQSLQRTPSN